MNHIAQFTTVEKKEPQTLVSKEADIFSRRGFLKVLGAGSCGLFTTGGWLIKSVDAQGRVRYGLIVVDFNKCTGCRTCEAVCSQANNKVTINGEILSGLGNPHLSNVRIISYHPPVDVPQRCAQCSDAPCIEACPVSPDTKTGRKALYRDEKTIAVKTDHTRCIACGSCARTCSEIRTGAIILNPETNKPEGICTLCDGDPACVKYCPFGALSYVQGGLDGRYYAHSSEEIAQQLINLWYYNQE